MAVFKDRISKVKISADRLDLFGKNYLKTKKLSPDAIMQLSFQVLVIFRYSHNEISIRSIVNEIGLSYI